MSGQHTKIVLAILLWALPTVARPEIPSSQPMPLLRIGTDQCLATATPSVSESGTSGYFPRLHVVISGLGARSHTESQLRRAYTNADFGGTTEGYWYNFFGWQFYVPPAHYPQADETGNLLNLQTEFSITRRDRIGVNSTGMDGVRVTGIGGEHEYVEGHGYGIYYKCVVIPAVLPKQRFEVACVAGYTQTEVNVDGDIASGSYAVSEKAPSLLYELTADFYFSRNVSLQLGLGGVKMRPVRVPEQRSDSKLLPAHNIDLSRAGAVLGLALHI